MRITFCGAAGEVTGSCYLVEAGKVRLLVDCGMFQGHGATEERNRNLGPVDPGRLDAVVATHAHLDHTGRLPILTARGFHGSLYMTSASADFSRIILLDSARLQESDMERRNRKHPELPPAQPLYGRADVEHLNPLIQRVPLRKPRLIADGVTVEFYEAGHILGSTSVLLSVSENGVTKTIVFSGDIGPLNSPILREFEVPKAANLVIQETTYGDRDHRSLTDTVAELRGILIEAVAQQKKILVPAFAIGRSQQIIYHVAELVAAGAIPPMPIYLDSPMAVEASQAYERHKDLFDAEAMAHLNKGDLKPTFDQLHYVRSVDESKALNAMRGPMMIIAGSGMCDGGRIVHHLRHNLPNPNTAVLIVGYQSPPSLGRRLVEGASEVRIFGEPVPVRASIHTMGGFSGHAGKTDLLQWAKPLAPSKPKWVLTHGEPGPRNVFRDALKATYGIEAQCPLYGDSVEL
ncbi:MAG: MBL fold metallo-hydrolase [Gemmataceae bacterium]